MDMKRVDVLAAVLLVIGGINWGLFGLLGVDLVAEAAGAGTGPARLAYAAVGLAALYQVVALRAIQRRWAVSTVRAR